MRIKQIFAIGLAFSLAIAFWGAILLSSCGKKEPPPPPDIAKLQNQVKELERHLKEEREQCGEVVGRERNKADRWEKQVHALIEACDRKDRQIKILSEK